MKKIRKIRILDLWPAAMDNELGVIVIDVSCVRRDPCVCVGLTAAF